MTSAMTVPHPTISFANVRPSVTLTATLSEDEVPEAVTSVLRESADALVVAHARELIARRFEEVQK